MEILTGIYHWLWTDTGVIVQLLIGGVIAWLILWFIRKMHPGQHPGEVIRAHFDTSRKFGLLYGTYHFLGDPPLRAAEWLGHQFTCWLLVRFPRIGRAWVNVTRSWVERWRKDGEALRAKEAALLARHVKRNRE